MTINNNFFYRFNKINYIHESRSQSLNNFQELVINQNSSRDNEESYILEGEIYNLKKIQDFLFIAKFLLACATFITPLIMGLIYYFNPNSVITIPIISGVAGGFMTSLGLLCGYDKYNSDKIVKKINQRNALSHNIFDAERALFQEGNISNNYANDANEEGHRISLSESPSNQAEYVSVANSNDDQVGPVNPPIEFNVGDNPVAFEDDIADGVDVFQSEILVSQSDYRPNPPRANSPSASISCIRGVGPNAVDVSNSLTNEFR